MNSKKMQQMTCYEWRKLGFFYDRNDDQKVWQITGSIKGLTLFTELLQQYAKNPNNDTLSAHEHYGPYQYLKIGTTMRAEITKDWIAGPLNDLLRFSSIIHKLIMQAKVGDVIHLKKEFAPNSIYDLTAGLKELDFDPAEADRICW